MNRGADTLLKIMKTAIEACHPARCLPAFLPKLPAKGRFIILGAGKAAAAMAATLEQSYLDQGYDPSTKRIFGHVATRHGYSCPTKFIKVTEAGHPIPDQASIDAAQSALRMAASAAPDDKIITLLSGGASAIWCAPVTGISLSQQQTLTTKLLHSGMPIIELNAIRKHLSKIKGGRLAKASNAAKMLTLAISDVPNDIPSAIGSGPTLGDPTSLEDARNCIKKYQVPVDENITAALSDPENETPKPADALFANNHFAIIATAKDAVSQAARTAARLGYQPWVIGDALQGEARDIARQHAILALQKQSDGGRAALISGGELTVTLTGNGTGGPNQEYLLALLIALNGASGISALAADTDGSDGGKGLENDPAGAFFTPETHKQAIKLNLNPANFLANNDSSTFFKATDSLIVTGPTQTNVNDIRIILLESK